MFGKHSIYFFFSLFVMLGACAPKVTVTPPSAYPERAYTLDELIERVGTDINVLKAIADIRIEKNSELFDFVKASVLIKRPGMVHIRIYKFGMLVKDFVLKDGSLFVLSGKAGDDLKHFGTEFYHAIFWWDAVRDGIMTDTNGQYVIAGHDRTVHVDHGTLLPLRQHILSLNGTILVDYDNPRDFDGFWYPETIAITFGEFTFDVVIKKLISNPALGENDFAVSAAR